MDADPAHNAELHELSQYRTVLRRFFSRRAHPADVDDLVQEVLMNVHARQASAPIRHIEGYLFTVATRSLARLSIRNRALGLQLHEDFDELSSDDASAERVVIGRENLARVKALISAQLPERTREVFVLHRFEEMTYPAIAAALSISVSAVEKHIMTALKILAAGMREAP